MAERSKTGKPKSRSLERGASAPFITHTYKIAEKDKKDPLLIASKMGHEFKKRTFYKPTYCQHCSEMLWGLINQGYQCTVCNFISHERCLSGLMVDCVHMLAEKITCPIAHEWVGPKQSKKKRRWCNVCRKKIHGLTYFCQVCRYFAHEQCRCNAFNNCKNCASYSMVNSDFYHHWIEGNLSSSAKCEVCGKNCYTDICLTGFRCGWCGISVHSNCLENYQSVPQNNVCTFRDLVYMIVPPKCVSMSVSQSTFNIEEIVDDTEVSQLFSPSEDDDPQDYGSKGRPVIIVDGSGEGGSKKWRKRTLHPVHVDAKTKAEELLRISLRRCGISSCPNDFYLAELIDVDENTERQLQSHELIYSLHTTSQGPLKLYIRKRNVLEPHYNLKVFNSKLKSEQSKVTLKIKENTTVLDIIKEALVLFKLKEDDPNNYCLYETNQTQGVKERVLVLDEKPWQHIQELYKDSLRSVNLLRYYLHPKEKITSCLYLWKVDSVHLQSKELAMDYIKRCVTADPSIPMSPSYEAVEIDVLFPQFGAFFVRIGCLATAEQLYTALSNHSTHSIRVIPIIHPQCLSVRQEPVLVFVNGRSGGNQGIELINGFCRHLNPNQVHDLSNGGPLPGLYSFRNVSKFRILVGGGDGTVGWVLGGLDAMRDHLTLKTPPCAVLPLGTGNDLARALKWGGGYSGEKVMQLLCAIEDANITNFDRWQVAFKEDDQLPTSPRSESSSPVPQQQEGENCKLITMNNYLGVGIDAEIALDFHQAREENPEKFNSRLHNKGVYLQLGVQKTFSRDTSGELHTQITLKVDGKLILLPTGLKGLVLLNIQSWGGGSEPWGSHLEEGFKKNSFDDGLLEVMGLTGPVHLGQIKGGIKNGLHIAQGKEIIITLSVILPVQVDGEAWMQPPGIIEVTLLPYQTVMLCKSPHSLYQRGLSQREVSSLLERNSVTGLEFVSSHRRRSGNAGQPPELRKGRSDQCMDIIRDF